MKTRATCRYKSNLATEKCTTNWYQTEFRVPVCQPASVSHWSGLRVPRLPGFASFDSHMYSKRCKCVLAERMQVAHAPYCFEAAHLAFAIISSIVRNKGHNPLPALGSRDALRCPPSACTLPQQELRRSACNVHP